jgi:hypothetical protein
MARLQTGWLAAALVVVLGFGGTMLVGAGSASAAPKPTTTVCSGGAIANGVYASLEISGACSIPDGGDVAVNGGLTLDPGSSLDQLSVSKVRINGNVVVGQGAVLGLGCTVIGMDCAANSVDRVGGNITAVNAETMYLDGVSVGGNVTSTGGGGLYDTFAFKDNTVKGNVTITGWNGGGWIGMIRNVVYGTVTYTNNTGGDYGSDPNDANEVVHNTVGRDLICSGNTPPAQFGDAVDGAPFDYRWNVVKGQAVDECAALVQH